MIAGSVAFVGIIALQIYLLRQAFDYEEKKFSQSIQVALLEVANEINKYYSYPTQQTNPVEKISRDQRKAFLENCIDGCEATIRGLSQISFGRKIIIADEIELK